MARRPMGKRVHQEPITMSKAHWQPKKGKARQYLPKPPPPRLTKVKTVSKQPMGPKVKHEFRKWRKQIATSSSGSGYDQIPNDAQEWNPDGDDDVEWYPQGEGEYPPMQEDEALSGTNEMWEQEMEENWEAVQQDQEQQEMMEEDMQ